MKIIAVYFSKCIGIIIIIPFILFLYFFSKKYVYNNLSSKIDTNIRDIAFNISFIISLISFVFCYLDALTYFNYVLSSFIVSIIDFVFSFFEVGTVYAAEPDETESSKGKGIKKEYRENDSFDMSSVPEAPTTVIKKESTDVDKIPSDYKVIAEPNNKKLPLLAPKISSVPKLSISSEPGPAFKRKLSDADEREFKRIFNDTKLSNELTDKSTKASVISKSSSSFVPDPNYKLGYNDSHKRIANWVNSDIAAPDNIITAEINKELNDATLHVNNQKKRKLTEEERNAILNSATSIKEWGGRMASSLERSQYSIYNLTNTTRNQTEESYNVNSIWSEVNKLGSAINRLKGKK